MIFQNKIKFFFCKLLPGMSFTNRKQSIKISDFQGDLINYHRPLDYHHFLCLELNHVYFLDLFSSINEIRSDLNFLISIIDDDK